MKLKATAFAILTILCTGVAPASSQAPEGAAKQKCKLVVKVVNGHKRKVKVCPKPKPVKSISLRLDSGARVSEPIVAAEGGTLTATSSAGAKLTLTVAKGALAADTIVSLTPVTSATGLPSGARLLAGVQFGPESTPLGKGATLSIESSRLSAAKNIHAIAWFGNGSYVSLWPGKRNGTTFTLPVAHFSGAAVYEGSRSGLLDAGGTSRPYYEQVVRPKLQQALTNDSLAGEAIQVWKDWERAMQLAGVGDDYLATERREAASLVSKAVHNALDKSFQRCVNQHHVFKEVQTMIQIGRIAALGGAEPGTGSLLDEAFDKAGKCARFELDFETVIEVSWSLQGGSNSGHETMHVRVQSLSLRPTGGSESFSKQIEYLTWDRLETDRTGGCSDEDDGFQLGDPFTVTRFELGESSLSMEVLPGKPTESTVMHCGGEVHHGQAPYYNNTFLMLHHDEVQGERILVSGWDVPMGSLYARKTYERTVTLGVGTYTERTTFDLRHTPHS